MLARSSAAHVTTTQVQQLRFTRNQTALVVLLFFVSLLNYVDRQVLSVLVPVLKQEIGLTTEQYSTLVNAFLLAYGIMYTGSGLVLDRVGSRVGLMFFVVSRT